MGSIVPYTEQTWNRMQLPATKNLKSKYKIRDSKIIQPNKWGPIRDNETGLANTITSGLSMLAA